MVTEIIFADAQGSDFSENEWSNKKTQKKGGNTRPCGPKRNVPEHIEAEEELFKRIQKVI